MPHFEIEQLPMKLAGNFVVNYIGIGTCCYSLWDTYNNQQYPHFLRSLKRDNPSLTLNLILMDPMFKDITTINCMVEMTQDAYYTNVYHTEDNINIYFFDKSVCYIPKFLSYVPKYDVLIDDVLSEMNMLCFEHNECALIVHDFSGLEIDVLADYFQPITELSDGKIMYDLSCRSGMRCLTDFSQLYCNITVDNTHIKIFENNESMCENHLLKLYINNYRRAKIWQLSRTDHNRRVIQKHELLMIDHLNNMNLCSHFDNGDADTFVHILEKLTFSKCNMVKIGEVELFDIISGDPRYWGSLVIDIFNGLHTSSKI